MIHLIILICIGMMEPNNCSRIITFIETEEYFKRNGREFNLSEYDSQLSSNNAFMFKLGTGEIFLVPSVLDINNQTECILFNNEQCFEECLAKDSFPIENVNKTIFELESTRIKNINEGISEYKSIFNKYLGLTNNKFDMETIEKYYLYVLSRPNKSSTEIVGLSLVLGEILRMSIHGKWALMKKYGSFNHYYVPLIITPEGKMIDPTSRCFSMVEAEERNLKKFFKLFPFDFISKKAYDDAGITINIID